jgi:Uma2 family endonuclease
MYTIFDEEQHDYVKVEEPDHSLNYTYADYMAWQFKERLELFRGKIFKMGAPTLRHQTAAGELFTRLYVHLKGKTCRVFIAPFDVRLPLKSQAANGKISTEDKDITTVVQPDVLIVCDPAKVDERGVCGAPDLCIEVLSPGNRKHELSEKYDVYEDAGVKEYWIVDPARKNVLVYLLLENGRFAIPDIFTVAETLRPVCVPDFSIKVADIFSS